MSMKFIKAGLETSIQDLGRFGQMHNGISRSGAMDPVAMQMANWLVSKPLDAAVIEITLLGPIIQFTSSMRIAICGAQFNCSINGKAIINDETITVHSGDILTFKKLQNGFRAYLAFSSKLPNDNANVKSILGSYSTHLIANFGGYKGRAFENNDYLEMIHTELPSVKKIPLDLKYYYSGNYILRTVPSVESSQYNEQQLKQFYSQQFTITPASNRMGIRLGGVPVAYGQAIDISSCGLTQGSIQVPPSGQPIISSVDGQTSGGYPRIANVISADLSILGQLKSGDKVRFSLIEKELARDIVIEKQARLDLHIKD